jgi:hypothetical protein
VDFLSFHLVQTLPVRSVKRRRQAEEELAGERLKQDEVRLSLVRRSQKFAAFSIRVFKWFVLLLLTFSTVYSFPWNIPSLSANWFRYALSLVQASFLVLAAIHLFWGTTLTIFLRKIESDMSKRIERTLARIAGVRT